MAREVLLYRCVERTTEINCMFRRKYHFGNELAGSVIWPHISELEDDGVVRDGDLGGVREGRARILRNGNSDRLFRHKEVIQELKRNVHVQKAHNWIDEGMQPHAHGTPPLMKKLGNEGNVFFIRGRINKAFQ